VPKEEPFRRERQRQTRCRRPCRRVAGIGRRDGQRGRIDPASDADVTTDAPTSIQSECEAISHAQPAIDPAPHSTRRNPLEDGRGGAPRERDQRSRPPSRRPAQRWPFGHSTRVPDVCRHPTGPPTPRCRSRRRAARQEAPRRGAEPQPECLSARSWQPRGGRECQRRVRNGTGAGEYGRGNEQRPDGHAGPERGGQQGHRQGARAEEHPQVVQHAPAARADRSPRPPCWWAMFRPPRRYPEPGLRRRPRDTRRRRQNPQSRQRPGPRRAGGPPGSHSDRSSALRQRRRE